MDGRRRHGAGARRGPGRDRRGDPIRGRRGDRSVWPDGLSVVGYVYFCGTRSGAEHYLEQLSASNTAVMLRFPIPDGSEKDPSGEMLGERRWTGTVASDLIEVDVDGRWIPIAEAAYLESVYD